MELTYFVSRKQQGNRKVLDGEGGLAVNLPSNSRDAFENVTDPRLCAAYWVWKHSLKYGDSR
jgi:hypothetical protein